jgi:hypothetical protein
MGATALPNLSSSNRSPSADGRHPRHPVIWSIIQSSKEEIFPPTMTITALEATKGIRSSTLASQARSSAAARASVYLANESSQHPRGMGTVADVVSHAMKLHRASSSADLQSDSFKSESKRRKNVVQQARERLLHQKSAKNRMVTVELFGGMVARLEKIIDADDALRNELTKQSYGYGQDAAREARSSRWAAAMESVRVSAPEADAESDEEPHVEPVVASSDIEQKAPTPPLSTNTGSSSTTDTDKDAAPSRSAARPLVRTVSFSSAALVAHALASTPKGQSAGDPNEDVENPQSLPQQDLRI